MRLKRKTYQVDTGRPLTDMQGRPYNLRKDFPNEESFLDFLHGVLTDSYWSVIGGTLPEVNYTFGDNPSDSRDLANYKEARDLLDLNSIKYWDPETTQRFVRMYNVSGKPRRLRKFLGPAHYYPAFHTMAYSDTRLFISELSHAFLHKNNVLEGKKSWLKNGVYQAFIRPFLKYKWAQKFATKIDPYDDPENTEYKAHLLIEPLISRYVFLNDEDSYNTLMKARGLPEDLQLDMFLRYLDNLSLHDNTE